MAYTLKNIHNFILLPEKLLSHRKYPKELVRYLMVSSAVPVNYARVKIRLVSRSVNLVWDHAFFYTTFYLCLIDIGLVWNDPVWASFYVLKRIFVANWLSFLHCNMRENFLKVTWKL